MSQAPWMAIGFVAAASILGATGQFIFQSAARHSADGVLSFLFSYRVWLGMLCYLSVMMLFTFAFKIGGTVRVLYPIYATTFIWAALMAWGWDGDPVRPVHVAGMALLVGGIYLMTY